MFGDRRKRKQDAVGGPGGIGILGKKTVLRRALERNDDARRERKRQGNEAMSALHLLLLAALASRAAHAVLNATVRDGVLSVPGHPDAPLPPTFSALQAAIAAYFAPLPPPAPSNHSLVQSPLYSYLTLQGGAWSADAPLTLAPSLLLVLAGGVVIAPAPAFPPWRGLIELNDTAYTGVIAPGGPADALFACANASVSPAAVWAVGSDNLYLEGLGVYGCGRTGGGALHVQGEPMAWGPTATGAVITGCRIWNSSRAIWTETVSGVAVHDNELFNNSGHTLDWDAFSHHSSATNNRIWGNAGREGIFIEQGAVGITVANNTIGPVRGVVGACVCVRESVCLLCPPARAHTPQRHTLAQHRAQGNGNGIAVFNNDMNLSTSYHFIVANTIFGNINAGIALGSTAPRAGQPNVGVHIAGNTLYGNGAEKRQGVHTNGAQVGMRISANRNADGISKFTQAGFKGGNITLLDPCDREIALDY